MEKLYNKEGNEINLTEVIIKTLEDNLKIKVNRDYDFMRSDCASYDVILFLGDKEISRTDFEIYT